MEAGHRTAFRTANSSFDAYGHEVLIECFEWQFNSVVYFPRDKEISRNVLGRHGWIQKFRLALIDYDSIIHLSHYDQL